MSSDTSPPADDPLPGPLSEDDQFAIDAIADDDRQLAVLRWLHDNAPVSEERVTRRVRSSPVADLDLDELLCLYRRLGLLRRLTRSDGPYFDTTAAVESVVIGSSGERGGESLPDGTGRTDRWAQELK